MTVRELLRAAHAAENINVNDEYLEDNAHRLLEYVIQSNAIVRYRHDYTITKEVEIIDGRVSFRRDEPNPALGSMKVNQEGKELSVKHSRGDDLVYIVIGGKDGPAVATFPPFPIIPRTLSDKVDVPDEHLDEVAYYVQTRIRIYRATEGR